MVDQLWFQKYKKRGKEQRCTAINEDTLPIGRHVVGYYEQTNATGDEKTDHPPVRAISSFGSHEALSPRVSWVDPPNGINHGRLVGHGSPSCISRCSHHRSVPSAALRRSGISSG